MVWYVRGIRAMQVHLVQWNLLLLFYNLGYKRGSVYDNVLFVDCNCYFRVISSMIGLTSSRWLDLYFKYGSRSDWSLNCLIP